MLAKNQVMFLRAARRLTRGTIMGMDISGAVGDGVFHLHVPLKSLVQITDLRNSAHQIRALSKWQTQIFLAAWIKPNLM